MDRRDILKHLSEILAAYNTSRHRGIKMSPAEMEMVEDAKKQYRREAEVHNERFRHKADTGKFQVGDRIRFRTPAGRFEKEGQTYSNEVLTVTKTDTGKLRLQLSDASMHNASDLIRAHGNAEQGSTRGVRAEEQARRKKRTARAMLQEDIDVVATRKSQPPAPGPGCDRRNGTLKDP